MKSIEEKFGETSLLNEMYEDFKNRAKSRIFPAYTVAWICANWKFIYLLIFARDENKIITEKLNQYSGVVSRHLQIDQLFGSHNIYVFTPLVGAVVYVIVMPYVNVMFGWLQMFSRVWEHKLDISTENRKNALLQIKAENLQIRKDVLESEFDLEIRNNPDMAKALAISRHLSEPLFKSIISKIYKDGLRKETFESLVDLKNLIGSAQYKISDAEIFAVQQSIESRLSNFEKGVLSHGKFDSYGRQELKKGLSEERIQTYKEWLNKIVDEISVDYMKFNSIIHVKYPQLVKTLLDGRS